MEHLGTAYAIILNDPQLRKGLIADAERSQRSAAKSEPISLGMSDRQQGRIKIPHAYFGWTEGNPIVYLLKFLAFGEGDTAPVTREVLRQTEPNPERRPRIHVG